MKDIINKPRVFLSHSKKDVDFINKIYSDLLKCQITPWLDDFEIRHGEPWLDAIFENGIPVCDSIIVYLTENSIQSPMVKKEIDASIIQKLKDNGISFLPYVSSGNLRDGLRSDLQALQIMEWDENNYFELLPRVVAEIWRSYMERAVSNAVNSQKVKSLEYQLELEKIKNQSTGIFSQSEEQDFQYIYETLDMNLEVSVDVYKVEQSTSSLVEKKKYYLSVMSLIPVLSSNSAYLYSTFEIIAKIESFLRSMKIIDFTDEQQRIAVKYSPDIADLLLTFGLLTKEYKPPSVNSHPVLNRLGSIDLVYSEKMQRFKYWLSYKQLVKDRLKMWEYK